MTVSISKGNTKLGEIPSVSLPALKTCGSVPCWKKCYARRYSAFRKNVRVAYENNYTILKNSPEEYWREVEATIMVSRFFRFHVSGEIPDRSYFDHMVKVARRNRHCTILCFTKKYWIVNCYLDEGHKLPRNLKIVFSVWPGFACDNPYNLPVAYVRLRDGSATVPDGAYECHGSCTECAAQHEGCWVLGRGESVVFNEH